MENVLKAAAVGVIVCVLAVLIRKHSKEQALMLSLITCVSVFFVLLGFLRAFRPVLEQLEDASGVSHALIKPVYQCTLIALVGHFAAGICKDAQENAIAESLALLATAASIYVCLPLILSVLSLIRQLMGGAS